MRQNTSSTSYAITTIVIWIVAIYLITCLASCTATKSANFYGNSDTINNCAAYN